jgi:hypothetical protein
MRVTIEQSLISKRISSAGFRVRRFACAQSGFLPTASGNDAFALGRNTRIHLCRALSPRLRDQITAAFDNSQCAPMPVGLSFLRRAERASPWRAQQNVLAQIQFASPYTARRLHAPHRSRALSAWPLRGRWPARCLLPAARRQRPWRPHPQGLFDAACGGVAALRHGHQSHFLLRILAKRNTASGASRQPAGRRPLEPPRAHRAARLRNRQPLFIRANFG